MTLQIMMLGLAWLLAPPALAAPDYNSDAYWAERQAREDATYKQLEAATAALKAERATLEALAPGTITSEQADAYYLKALDWIYADFAVANSEGYGVPVSLDSLATGSHTEGWPGDPLAGWAPLPLLELGAPAVPGGVVYQRCPAEYCSVVRYGSTPYLTPLAYEISIYGAGLQTNAAAAPDGSNSNWAQVPVGTLALRGASSPPARAELEPWDDAKALLDGARAQDARERAALAYFRANIVLPEDNPNLRVEIALSCLDTILAQARRCQELEPQLRAASSLAEQHGALKEYLNGNLWQVIEAVQAHEWIYGTYCWEIPTLVQKKLLPAVPLNPLSGWQPLRILALEDGFQPGELCLQLPSTCWFGGLRGGIGPESHVLSVYGDAPDTRYANEAALSFGYNMDWAVLPAGTLQILSGFSQTQLQTDYRRAKCNI